MGRGAGAGMTLFLTTLALITRWQMRRDEKLGKGEDSSKREE